MILYTHMVRIYIYTYIHTVYMIHNMYDLIGKHQLCQNWGMLPTRSDLSHFLLVEIRF